MYRRRKDICCPQFFLNIFFSLQGVLLIFLSFPFPPSIHPVPVFEFYWLLWPPKKKDSFSVNSRLYLPKSRTVAKILTPLYLAYLSKWIVYRVTSGIPLKKVVKLSRTFVQTCILLIIFKPFYTGINGIRFFITARWKPCKISPTLRKILSKVSPHILTLVN